MEKLKRMLRGEFSSRELQWGKRIMASVMLPILIFQMTSMNFLALELMTASAADGSGTMTVDDDDVTAGGPGQTFKFTFDPSEDMDGGAVKVTVPDSWKSPQLGDLSGDGDVLVEGKNGADLDVDNDGSPDVSIAGREITIDIETMSASDYFTLKYNVATIPTLAGDYEFTTESSLNGTSFDELSDSRQARVEVEAGPVSYYRITNASGGDIANQKVGVDFDVKVTAYDVNNNITPLGSSSVAITADDSAGSLSGDLSADTSGDGMDTLTLKYSKPVTGLNLIPAGVGANQSNSFDVANLTIASTLTAPGSSTNDSTPLINWASVDGTDVTYQMQLVKKGGACDFTSPLLTKSTSGTSEYQLTAEEALNDQETYCVKVTATDYNANSVVGNYEFNLLTSKPAVPSKVYIEEIGDPSTNGHPENVINIYNNESVSVKVYHAATLDGGKVYVKIKDGLGNETSQYNANISGAVTSTTVSEINASSLQQGDSLDIYARVEDAGTNSSDWTTTTDDEGSDDYVTKDTSSPARPTSVTLADPVNIANEGAANLNVVGEANAQVHYGVSSTGGGTNVTSSFFLDGDGDTTTTVNTNDLNDGTLTATVYLVDDAWNHSSAQTDTATKDATAPTVTLTAMETSPTNDSPLHITAQFSETVTDFVAGDITLGNDNDGAVESFVAVDGDTYTFQVTPDGQGAVTVDVAGSKAVDAVGNNNTAATQLLITFDSSAPTLAFDDGNAGTTDDNVEAGPVTSDTIVGNWGDASIKKWKYNNDTTCSEVAGDYDKTNVDSMDQVTQANNGKYICLYGEDAAGNHSTLVSTNDINIDITGPTLSFTDNVEVGPVASDVITGSWDDASVKMWKYNADTNCPDGPSGYTDSTAIPTQADQTNNGKYICLYGADALGNESVLASSNDINIDSEAPTVTAISSPTDSNLQNFNITYTANDGSGVGSIYGRIFYKLNGEAGWHQYDYPGVDDDYVVYTGDNSTIEFVASQPGSYQFYVQVKDGLGTASSLETPVTTTNAVPTEVWVCETGNCGHAAGWNAFNSIQTGIDAIKEGASNIVNVSGSFSISTYIDVNKELKLIGNSASITRTNAGAVISIGDSNVSVEGFSLNVYSDAASTGIYLKDKNNAVVHNNTITSSSPFGIGIYVENSDGNTFSNNTITNFSGDGIAINRGSDNNLVFGNTLTGATTGSNSAINFYDGATGNIVGGDSAGEGNIISLATSGSGNLYGIYLSGTNAGNNTIKNNTFNGGTRFVQQDGGISGTTTISGNSVGETTAPAWGGVILGGGSAVISGNTLKDSVRPIEFWGVTNVTISGNTINGSTFDGINAGSASGTIVINGDNKIYNIANGSFGIHVQGGVAGIEIDGNEIYGNFDGTDNTGGSSANGSRGIGIESGATGAEITNNNIHNNSWSALVLSETVNTITGNTFNANARGIEATASFAANDKNKFTNGSYCSACLYADGKTYNLANNWWGTNQKSSIEAQVADNGRAYTYAPWYMDEAMTVLSSSDATGPTAVLSDDHVDALVNDNDTVVITATFSDTSGLDTGVTPEITITKDIDSSKLVDGAAMSGSGNVWTYSWDVPTGDGAVTVSVEAYDIVGNVNQTAAGKTAYTIDNTGPEVGTVNVPAGTYNSAQSVTITPAVDAVATYYTIDGTVPNNTNGISGTGPITIDGNDGVTVTLKYISYDLVGNPSSVSLVDYLFDKTGPTVVITRNPDRNFFNGDYSLSVNYGDSVPATMQYRVDGGTWTSYTAPVTVSSLGTHTFDAKGTDAAGNIGNAAQVVFTIDKTNPTASISYSDADAKVKAGDSLTITATFDEPMLDSPIPQITIGGENTVAQTDMIKVDDTHYTYLHTVGAGNGTANITLQTGTDRAGNLITATPTSGGSFTVDNTAPAAPISIVADPASWSTVNAFDVSWTNPADATGIAGAYYKIDGGAEVYVAGNNLTTLSDLVVSGEGTHTIKVWLEDLVGNKDETNNSSTVNIYYDATASSAPTVTSSTHSIEDRWYNNNDPALDWSGLDDTSGIVGYSYILDQTADTEPDTVVEGVETNKTYSDKADGTWYFHIKAKNGSGLWSGVTHRTIKIDTSTPNSSVTTGQDTYRSQPFNVKINSLVVNPSGVQDIDLYARYDANDDGDYVDENEFDWTNQNIAPSSLAVDGNFAFNPQSHDGWYQFYSLAQNNAGTWEVAPVSADRSAIYDNTDPSAVVISSGLHTKDVWSDDNTIDFSWTASTDAISGFKEYYYLLDNNSLTVPGSSNKTTGTVFTTGALIDDDDYWFHVVPVDNAGNADNVTHLGPFKIDTTDPDIDLNHSADFEKNTGEAIQISVDVTDAGSGVDEVTLFWRQEGGSWNEEEMNDGDGDEYTKTISAQYNPNIDIDYYIEATDNVGNESSDGSSSSPNQVDIVAPVDKFSINTDTVQTDGTRFAATITAKDEFNNDALFTGTAVISVDGYDGTWKDLDEGSYTIEVNDVVTNNLSFSNQTSRSVIVKLQGTGTTSFGTIRIHAEKSDDPSVSGNSADISITGFSATVAGATEGADVGTSGESTGGESPVTQGEQDGALVPEGEQTTDNAVAPWWKRFLPWMEAALGLAFVGWAIPWWIRRRGGGAGGSNLTGIFFSTLKTAGQKIRMFLW